MITSLNIITGSHQSYRSTHGPASHDLGATRPRQYRRVIPVYLGIGTALLALKLLNRSWEGFLTGISTGILVYLFFDLMHEAVELTGATNPLSWVAFLGSLLIGFVGLVAFEQRQQRTNRLGSSR